MEIRTLSKADLESLLQLYIQLDEKNSALSLETCIHIWESEIEPNTNIRYFGAVQDGKVVSTCYAVLIPNLTNDSRGICFIENVVTDIAFRKQGLAKAVIGEAVAYAKAHHCYKVILQSGIARKEAHRFYESIGFNGESKKAFDMRLSDR